MRYPGFGQVREVQRTPSCQRTQNRLVRCIRSRSSAATKSHPFVANIMRWLTWISVLSPPYASLGPVVKEESFSSKGIQGHSLRVVNIVGNKILPALPPASPQGPTTLSSSQTLPTWSNNPRGSGSLGSGPRVCTYTCTADFRVTSSAFLWWMYEPSPNDKPDVSSVRTSGKRRAYW